jgi:alpha-beta hydrolase superfamily lysophospholipase
MLVQEETWSSDDGVGLHAVNWIPDSMPKATIGFVHGIGEHVGRYSYVGDYLTRAGYALFSYDLRGHGKSGGRRGDASSYEALLDDIEILIHRSRSKFPDLPCFLYGHSMGGNLVLNYVVRRNPNLTGIIVSAPGLKPASVGPVWKLPAARIFRFVLPALLVANEINATDLSRDAEVVRQYQADPLVHDRVSLRLGVSLVDAGAWICQRAEEFHLPLLVLQGGGDRVVDVETNLGFAQRAGRLCSLKVWPGLYHELHNEPEKDQVLAELKAWLDTRVLTG